LLYQDSMAERDWRLLRRRLTLENLR
jgi:hypothetical protein